MKIHTPDRPNYSRSAKLCDQNLYHISAPLSQQPKTLQPVVSSSIQLKKLNQDYFFRSVSRQKRGNFRFNIVDNKGQFNYHPNYHYGKPNIPSWTTPKQEKYPNEKLVQYEFCEKHPLIREQQVKLNQTQSIKSMVHNENSKLQKSSSFLSTNIDLQKNYSIISHRRTSRSGFFNHSKIKSSNYLSRSQVCNLESQEDQKNYTNRLFSNKKGLVEFDRQLPRKPNVVRKSFQYFVKSYNHEDQFNNYHMAKYPPNPEHQVEFAKQLKRQELFGIARLGPNSQVPSIQFTKPNQSNINYKLSTFRDKVRTRYDRAQPEPNTRLDIDVPKPKLSGMVTMDKVIARHRELFPIVDSIIKKHGDKQMREELKKNIFNFEVNQAYKLDNPDISIRKALS